MFFISALFCSSKSYERKKDQQKNMTQQPPPEFFVRYAGKLRAFTPLIRSCFCKNVDTRSPEDILEDPIIYGQVVVNVHFEYGSFHRSKVYFGHLLDDSLGFVNYTFPLFT